MNTIQQVRADSAAIEKQANGRTAVIVSTKFSPRRNVIGVQFWTNAMISAGSSTNSDRSVSRLVELL